MRRTLEERAAEAQAKAQRLHAEAERRLSVATDPMCALLWDAEKAVRACERYSGPETGREKLKLMGDELGIMRDARWEELKEIRDGTARDS